MLRVLTSTSNPIEQSLLLARLSDAGIPCMRRAGGHWGVLGGGRDILVEEEDLARAQEILKEDDEGFDEDELARLSEEAGRHAAEATSSAPQSPPTEEVGAPTSVEPEAPARRIRRLNALEKLVGDKDTANSPFGR